MEEVKYKAQIWATFEDVRRLSFEEKKESVYSQAKVDAFLDKILEFKKTFAEKTLKITVLIENIEKITWFNDVDNEALMSINDLISSIRDLQSTLIRQYVSLNFIRNKGIAKDEIKEFKAAIDDLKDVAADLESRYFFLPRMVDFQDVTKELSLF